MSRPLLKQQSNLNLPRRKLESYLVLFEITKELLKSKSFDDFFENLMYSDYRSGRPGDNDYILL